MSDPASQYPREKLNLDVGTDQVVAETENESKDVQIEMMALDGAGKDSNLVPQLPVVSQDDLYQTKVLYQKFSRETCYCSPAEPDTVCCGSKWWLHRAIGTQWIHRSRIVKSYFFPSVVCLVLRTVAMMYSTIVLLHDVITSWSDGYWFAYYTHLTYVGLTVYFWVGWIFCFIDKSHTFFQLVTFIHFQYLANKKQLPSRNQPPAVIDIVCCVLYTINFSMHILVPVVYWGLLGRSFDFQTAPAVKSWSNVSQHGMDYVLMMIEFFCNRIVFTWGHINFRKFYNNIWLLFLINPCSVHVYRAVLALDMGSCGNLANKWSHRVSFWSFKELGLLNICSNGFPYFFVDYTVPINYAFMIGVAVLTGIAHVIGMTFHLLRSYLNTRLNKK